MQSSQAHSKLKALGEKSSRRLLRMMALFIKRWHLDELAISFVFSFLLVAMIRYDVRQSFHSELKLGQISEINLRSPIDFEFEDPTLAFDDKKQILNRVAQVFDYDQESLSHTLKRWREGVTQMRAKPRSQWANPEILSQVFGFSISKEEAKALASLKWDRELERSISFAVGSLWDQKISEQNLDTQNMIEILTGESGKSQFLKGEELRSVMSVAEARSLVERAGRLEVSRKHDREKSPWATWSELQRSLVLKVQARLIRANLVFNTKENERRRTQVLAEYQAQKIRVEKGEIVVRAGERMNVRSELIVNEILKRQNSSPERKRILFESLFASFFLWLVVLFLRENFPKSLQGRKNNIVCAGLLLTSVACFKLTSLFMMNVVAEYFRNIPATFFLFLIPVALPAMMIRLLIHLPFASIVGVFFAVSASVLFDEGAAFGAHVLVVSLMSVHFLKHCPTRGSLHVAGFKSAAVSGLSSLAILSAWSGTLPSSMGVFQFESFGTQSLMVKILWTFFGGFVGGWLSSALALMLTPLFESVLDYTTDLKLLELARMDNPLLKDLVLKAPGTYHHSIVVGSLVEAACEAVGANALLARVGSYYHDIGKIGRSEYFVENQSNGRNPHDAISPHMSAKIIISHVKEGIKMAESAKLGDSLIEFIRTHHGNALVSFFYNKAKQEAAQPSSRIELNEVHEADFRYPGPKPVSKEAAIVSLADSCEAATRSLVEPTPARIDGMVKKIISKAFNEGLLDEAEITLREVNLVGVAFIRILLGIHHNRIQYHNQEEGLPPKENTLAFISSRRTSE